MLIDLMMTDCVIMDKRTESDGEGGYITRYVDGAPIRAAVVLDSSLMAQIAEADGVTDVYTVTTPRNVILGFHDVIKRVNDGAVFRITNDGYDKVAPDISTIRIRQVTAERWNIPKEV